MPPSTRPRKTHPQRSQAHPSRKTRTSSTPAIPNAAAADAPSRVHRPPVRPSSAPPEALNDPSAVIVGSTSEATAAPIVAKAIRSTKAAASAFPANSPLCAVASRTMRARWTASTNAPGPGDRRVCHRAPAKCCDARCSVACRSSSGITKTPPSTKVLVTAAVTKRLQWIPSVVRRSARSSSTAASGAKWSTSNASRMIHKVSTAVSRSSEGIPICAEMNACRSTVSARSRCAGSLKPLGCSDIRRVCRISDINVRSESIARAHDRRGRPIPSPRGRTDD